MPQTADSKPKVLIFAPREEPPETVNALRALGCELVLGDRAWQQPRGAHEDAVVEAARGAVALMGTSMRHTPITRRIMQASQRLRVVAKYTVGVDDNDTEAATDLGIMVCGIPDNVYNRDVIPRWRERFGGASIAAA
ncbi:MAG TPA: hypothetical protein VH684_01155 [Xanthobacteraceae bacterium]